MAEGAFRQVIRRLVPRRLRWLVRAAFKRITGLYHRDMMARLWDTSGRLDTLQNEVSGIQDSVRVQAAQIEAIHNQVSGDLPAIQETVRNQAAQVEAQGEVMDLLLRRLRVSQEEVGTRLSTLEEQVGAQLHRLEKTQDALRSDLSQQLERLENNLRFVAPLAGSMHWTVSSEPPLEQDELVMSRALSNFYVRFQDRHRGSEDMIRERQRGRVAYFASCHRVLDIGAGRGEFLELLREQRIPAEGIDVSPASVDVCQAKGLTVQQAEALAYLSMDDAGTFDGIHMSHLLEHVTFPKAVRLLEVCADRLEPGGVLVAETPNPRCPEALQGFFLDPTHVRPLFPEALTILLKSLGFEQVEVHFLNPIREERMGTPERGPHDFADYLVVGIKAPAEGITTPARKQAVSSKRRRKGSTSAKRP